MANNKLMFFVAQGFSKFLFLSILFVSTMHTTVPNALIGKWKGEDQPNNHPEFFLAKDGFYYAKLIYEGGETKNIGNLIFKKVKFNSVKNNYQGKMCPPDADLEINTTISFITPNKLKIVLKKNTTKQNNLFRKNTIKYINSETHKNINNISCHYN